jgi:hypothetical protein
LSSFLYPGAFDRGFVYFTKFNVLRGTPDILLFKNMRDTNESPLSLMRQLVDIFGQDPDFSRDFTLDPLTVTALKLAGYAESARGSRDGVDALIRAEFKPGTRPDDYFWSQLVRISATSDNKQFLDKWNLRSQPWHWDGGYEYSDQKREGNSLTLRDRPSITIRDFQGEVKDNANGSLTFKPSDRPSYTGFTSDFSRLNSTFEVSFVTQLRRLRQGVDLDRFYAGLCQGAGWIVGSPAARGNVIGGIAGLTASLDGVSEAVGQYTWGFKITSRPYNVIPILPKWQKLK